jgi:NTP pyrophosphatase (non-canonical NTP hydrolase)
MAGNVSHELVTDGFDIYQDLANNTAIYPDNVRILYPALGLGEAGEVQGKIKKIYRDKGGEWSAADRMEVAKELGDLLWYIAAVARDLNVSMGYIATQNLEKLQSRQERGVLGGSGDNR